MGLPELKIATMAWISPLPLLNFHPNHPEMQFFAMAIGKAPANDVFLPEVQQTLGSSSGLNPRKKPSLRKSLKFSGVQQSNFPAFPAEKEWFSDFHQKIKIPNHCRKIGVWQQKKQKKFTLDLTEPQRVCGNKVFRNLKDLKVMSKVKEIRWIKIKILWE